MSPANKVSSANKSTKGNCAGAASDDGRADTAPPARGQCKSARPGRRTSRAAFAGEAPDEDDPLLGFTPYRHKAPRSNSITPARQLRFVMALAASGIVTQAAREVGVSLEALYRLRHRPGAEDFAAAWDRAIDRGMARLEDCALERAIQGEERLIIRQGKVVGRWRRYDTQLLIFLLRQRRAERFHDGRFLDRVELLRLHQGFRDAIIAQEDAADDREAIMASINAKFDRMRARMFAEETIRAEEEAQGGAEPGCGSGGDAKVDGGSPRV